MRSFISLFIVLSFLTMPVFSQNLQGNIEQSLLNSKIKAPEFSEFAPPKYVNAIPNNEGLTAVEKAFSKIFIISFVGLPIGLLMKENVQLREKNNKWADRKANFEASLKYCQALDTEKELKSCYKNLRKIELYKNADKTKGDIKLQSSF